MLPRRSRRCVKQHATLTYMALQLGASAAYEETVPRASTTRPSPSPPSRGVLSCGSLMFVTHTPPTHPLHPHRSPCSTKTTPESGAALHTRHSLRRGGTTLALELKVDVLDIKRHGDWRSDVVYTYHLSDATLQTLLSRLRRLGSRPSLRIWTGCALALLREPCAGITCTHRVWGLSASGQLLPRPAPPASRSKSHQSLVGGRA